MDCGMSISDSVISISYAFVCCIIGGGGIDWWILSDGTVCGGTKSYGGSLPPN